jgi:hypothetical protein
VVKGVDSRGYITNWNTLVCFRISAFWRLSRPCSYPTKLEYNERRLAGVELVFGLQVVPRLESGRGA